MHQTVGSGGKLAVKGIKIEGTVNVFDNSFDDITFCSVDVKCPRQVGDRGEDAVCINTCKGKFLLLCCEIIGGSDGLAIMDRDCKMHIRETDIQLARSRGIFSNPYFKIEDSAVYSCGGYGIKGRSGWEAKGENQIQAGPWNEHGGASAY